MPSRSTGAAMAWWACSRVRRKRRIRVREEGRDAGFDLAHRSQPILTQAKDDFDWHVAGIVKCAQFGDKGGTKLGTQANKELLKLIQNNDQRLPKGDGWQALESRLKPMKPMSPRR